MNIEDLQEHVWQRIGVRRIIVGRETINDIVLLAVEEWPGELLKHAKDEDQQRIVLLSTLSSIKRGYQMLSNSDVIEYGFLWTLLLQGVVSAVVQIVLRWWLERPTHRTLLLCWQADRTVR